MNRKHLYLIDGMSHIYRAYYAIRNLRTSKGLVTNSIYGFTTMLRKLIQEVFQARNDSSPGGLQEEQYIG